MVLSSAAHKVVEAPHVEVTAVFTVFVPGAQASARSVVHVHWRFSSHSRTKVFTWQRNSSRNHVLCVAQSGLDHSATKEVLTKLRRH